MVVEKVGRNAIAELVNQARNHPQRGDRESANPAYAAMAELAQIFGMDGLALGLKAGTGEISFLDLDKDQRTAFVDRELNKILWRQLKKLVNMLVDRNMLGPRLPIRAPEDYGEEPDDSDSASEGLEGRPSRGEADGFYDDAGFGEDLGGGDALSLGQGSEGSLPAGPEADPDEGLPVDSGLPVDPATDREN
jgi:hypothetical protein